MTTYGDVRTKFIARMKRRDMTTADADGFLQDAITRIQRTLRVPAMEKAIVVNVDDDFITNGGVFIPNDFLQLRQITYNDTSPDRRELVRNDISKVLPLTVTTGCPEVFCRRGGLYILGPTPEGPYTASDGSTTYNTVRVDYYAEFAEMTETTDETVLTSIASDLIIYGALSYGCDHFNDKRGDKFEARFIQISSDLEGMGDDDETSGSAAVQPLLIFNDGLEDCE